MKKVFLLSFILILGVFITITPVLFAQNNNTDVIKVEINDTTEDLILNYTIRETFGPDAKGRHGIFYNINKEQDGVVYNFELLDLPKKDGVIEKYNTINELTSFRFRIGDPNIQLEPKTYTYTFSIKAKANKTNKHQFTPIYDWKDPISNIEVIYNGRELCAEGVIICNRTNTLLTFNPTKQPSNKLLAYLTIFQSYILAIVASVILWLTGLKKLITDPFKKKILNEVPYYTPPQDMLPWDCQSLINKGNLNVKDSFASYLLYLNHKNYIEIKPDKEREGKVTITKLQTLPQDLMPEEVNKTVEMMITNGVNNGLLDVGIDESTINQNTNKFVLNRNNNYYKNKPELMPFSYTIIVGLIGFVPGAIFFGFIQDRFGVGNSLGLFIVFIFLIFLLFLYIYLKNKDKLSEKGCNQLQESIGYKYYLSYIEKEKLDFSNNPKDGIQFYLNTVPYAAQFGILKQFNSYFKSLEFMPQEIVNDTSFLASSINSAPFYIPPSSGGDGSGGGGGASGGGGSW
jgi:Predicted membrane protein (DUF2207)